jgi:peptidyl-prolyl cis-trans isomerase SurA
MTMKLSSAFLFLLLASVNAEARLVDKTLALENGDVILQSDLATFRKNQTLRREIDPFVSLTNFSSDSTKDIQDYLIQEKLVLQKATPTEDEVEEEINSVQRNNRIGRDQLKEVLKGQGVNFEDYRALMSIAVAKRKLLDRDLRPLAAVSDDDVKNFYYTDAAFKNRQKEQKLVLTYGLQQLILPSSALAEEASRRIRAGEDFDAVTADMAGKGAESSRLPAISEENMNAKIKDAIQGLKVGEATKPVSAGSGYLILKVTSVSAPKDQTFEKEKERIRGLLFQKALVNQLKIWTERERAASYVHISAS